MYGYYDPSSLKISENRAHIDFIEAKTGEATSISMVDAHQARHVAKSLRTQMRNRISHINRDVRAITGSVQKTKGGFFLFEGEEKVGREIVFAPNAGENLPTYFAGIFCGTDDPNGAFSAWQVAIMEYNPEYADIPEKEGDKLS